MHSTPAVAARRAHPPRGGVFEASDERQTRPCGPQTTRTAARPLTTVLHIHSPGSTNRTRNNIPRPISFHRLTAHVQRAPVATQRPATFEYPDDNEAALSKTVPSRRQPRHIRRGGPARRRRLHEFQRGPASDTATTTTEVFLKKTSLFVKPSLWTLGV